MHSPPQGAVNTPLAATFLLKVQHILRFCDRDAPLSLRLEIYNYTTAVTP